MAAADFARSLDLLNGQRPDVTFNVSRIDGGGAPNVVPDLGICRFNVRVKTEEDAIWAKSETGRAGNALDERLSSKWLAPVRIAYVEFDNQTVEAF